MSLDGLFGLRERVRGQSEACQRPRAGAGVHVCMLYVHTPLSSFRSLTRNTRLSVCCAVAPDITTMLLRFLSAV